MEISTNSPFFQLSPVSQIVVGWDLNVISINPKAEETFKGFIPQSKVPFYKWFTPKIGHIIQQRFREQQSVLKESPFSAHVLFQHKLWELKCTPISEENILVTFLLAEDQRNFPDSDEMLYMFTDFPISLLLLDESSKCLLSNQRACDLLGFAKQDLKGVLLTDLCVGEDKLKIHRFFQELNLKKRSHFTAEVRIKPKDREEIWCELNFASLKNPNQRFSRGLLMIHNITLRKKTELMLSRNRRWIDEISENIPVGIVVSDLDGKVNRINPFFTEIFGYTLSDFSSISAWANLVFPDPAYRAEMTEKWQKDLNMAKQGLPHLPERIYKLTCNNGQEKDVAIRFKIVNQRVLTIFNDISKLKDKERQLMELNDTKDKFFSIIAHDLKNPFNTLLGFGELLGSDWEIFSDEEIREYVGLMTTTAQKGFSLLENLLDWAKEQINQAVFLPQAIRISEFFANQKMLFEESAQRKHISIVLEMPNEYVVSADLNMLRTIFRNLIGNAIKFTPKYGQITLVAKELKGYIRISVKDNGMGIPPDQVDSIFKFVNKTITPGTDGEKGTGLGLVLTKDFVEKHGGQIKVKSKLGEGTSFSFTLPKQQCEVNP